MAKFTDIRIISIVGGDPLEAQFEALANRPDVIIATPGRLMHHLREISTFKLKTVKYLVFDEADRLFEMGVRKHYHDQIIAYTYTHTHTRSLTHIHMHHTCCLKCNMKFLTLPNVFFLLLSLHLISPLTPLTLVCGTVERDCA